jgi:uncharacterized membrane protein HdeD (DUF308 family)
MSAAKVVGIVLIVAGILALVYKGFTYTKETHSAKIPIVNAEIKVQDKERVAIPTWAGVAAIVVGGALLATGRKS